MTGDQHRPPHIKPKPGYLRPKPTFNDPHLASLVAGFFISGYWSIQWLICLTHSSAKAGRHRDINLSEAATG